MRGPEHITGEPCRAVQAATMVSMHSSVTLSQQAWRGRRGGLLRRKERGGVARRGIGLERVGQGCGVLARSRDQG